MRALLDGTTILQDNDMVGLLYSREAMRDGDGSTVPGYPVKCCLNYPLALGIYGAGCFVEDDDLRLLDDASGDG